MSAKSAGEGVCFWDVANLPQGLGRALLEGGVIVRGRCGSATVWQHDIHSVSALGARLAQQRLGVALEAKDLHLLNKLFYPNGSYINRSYT